MAATKSHGPNQCQAHYQETASDESKQRNRQDDVAETTADIRAVSLAYEAERVLADVNRPIVVKTFGAPRREIPLARHEPQGSSDEHGTKNHAHNQIAAPSRGGQIEWLDS